MIQFLRGNASQNDAYAGPAGSITIDNESSEIRVHDGTTTGGAFSVGVSEASSTNLSVNYTATSFTVTSSTGTNATINAATATDAGAMSSSDKSKLDGIESNATADQTAGEIKTAYESNSDTNAFTDSEKSKLGGIEAGADVNRAISSTAQSEAGTNNTTVLTPLRLFEALEAGNWSVDFGSL